MKVTKKTTLYRYLAILLIVLGGTALRISYNANTLIVDPVRADAASYLKYAHNLLDYGVFSKDIKPPPIPDAYWAPGFPLYLTAVIKTSQWLDRDTYNFILASQVLLGAGTIWLCFLLSASFLPGYWPLLPAMLAAASPHMVATASYVLTETLFGFLLLLSLHALSRALMSSRKIHWLLTGLSFTACYLVNPIAILLPPLLAIALLLHKASRTAVGSKRKLLHCTIMLVAPVIVVSALWSVRGTLSVPPGQPTSSGRLLTNLVIGLYPDYHEKWRDSILKPAENIEVPGVGIDDSYNSFFDELTTRFAMDPTGMLHWYAIAKPALLWDWNIRTGWGDIYIYRIEYSLYQTSAAAIAGYSVMKILHSWLLTCALLGTGYLLFANQRNGPIPAMIYFTLLYLSGVYILTQSEPRYSIPMRPEMYICASFFLWRSWEWVQHRRQLNPASADQTA